jgi:hypothetical protein
MILYYLIALGVPSALVIGIVWAMRGSTWKRHR